MRNGTLVLSCVLVGCASGVPASPARLDAGRAVDAGPAWSFPDATAPDATSDAGATDAHALAASDAGPPPRDALREEDGGAGDAGRCTCARLESCIAGRCVPFPSCAGSGACAPGAQCRGGLCVPGDRDLDGDGVAAATDCDEMDATIRPGALEVCNGRDDDCDGAVDPPGSAGGSTYYRDGDGDGVGAIATITCARPAGHVTSGGDCDDASASRRPGLAERCDTLDNDCDGAADEAGCLAGCFGALRGAAAYFVCTGSRTWESAQAGCDGRGAHLVRVDDNAENNWIRSQADARGLTSVWLGGADATTEGRWTWRDGARFWSGDASGSAVGSSFTRWSSGEPNDDGGEDCLELAADRSWNDDECTSAHAFVCEF